MSNDDTYKAFASSPLLVIAGAGATIDRIESLLAANKSKWDAYQVHRRESSQFPLEQASKISLTCTLT